MNDASIQRLQDDLDSMRQVAGFGPALTMSQVYGFAWLAFTGLLLTGFSAAPDLIPGNWELLVVLMCWIALPIRGLVSRALGKQDRDFDNAQRSLPRFYSPTVLAIAIVVLVWAYILDLPWPITIGVLFFIEALPLLIVSVADEGRRSGLGLALALVVCGFGFPLVQGSGMGLLLGIAIFSGCALSAGILYWQCQHKFVVE